MNKFLCVLLIALCPFLAYAEKTLSKELVKNLGGSLVGLEQLMEEYPELEDAFEQNLLSVDKEKVFKSIKSLPYYPKIEEIIKSSGFDDLEEYYNISSRVMGALFAVQTSKMPEGISLDKVSNILKESIDRMKKEGAPEDLIAQMELEMAQQSESMHSMALLAKSTSVADKEFVEKNLPWIMQNLSSLNGDM